MQNQHLTQEEADQIVDRALEKAKELLQRDPMIAQIVLKQLLKAVPNHPEGLQLLGLCAHQMGAHAEAIELMQMAIEVAPESSDNYNNIALAYACVGNFHKAIECLEKALELKPDQYLYMNNLALQLRQVGRHFDAIDMFHKALSIKRTPQMLTNLGGIYGELKQLDKAMECFQEALELDPDMAATHVDVAYTHHLRGEWDAGFKEYEWRFKHFPQLQMYLDAYDQSKLWKGEDLDGKTILLYGEQGLGDMIMFVRYIPELKKRGATVVLHCSSSLRSMFDRCEYIDKTFIYDVTTKQGEPFPEYDYQCSTMSLPSILGSYETSNEPYLSVPKRDPMIDHYGDKHEVTKLNVAYPETFNIGIVWAGSAAHPKDASRSVPLKLFRPIYDMEGVKLFSFQIDTRKRQYKYQEGEVDLVEGAKDMVRLVDMKPEIKDFDDTAYFLSGLDLLITVDTSILHLAGALGLPTWGLIQHIPDWRWTLTGESTIWYPSVRLFRQPKVNDWEGAMDNVKAELEILLQNKRPKLRKI